MSASDMPPEFQERVVCSISAAFKYEIPANIILAVAEKEGGKAGQWVRNANGTHDVGPMQFNTAYLGELARYGIAPSDVAAAGCYSFDLAAWRLRLHIKNDSGDIWTRVANYHSRTERYNVIYRADLIIRAAKWANWLETRFVTYNFVGVPRSMQTKDAKLTQTTTKAYENRTTNQATWKASDYVPRRLIINDRR